MILKGEYADFTEFPPAKGEVKSLPNLEGNILVIQAADLAQYKKLIPDLATWIQCFTIFMAIITKHQPDRSSELLAYMNLIVRASTKYKWPSWVIYDQNFRLEAAMGEQVDWAKSDASLFAQCFTGRHLVWNRGAKFVIHWITAQSSAHILPPNPSGLNLLLHGTRFNLSQFPN